MALHDDAVALTQALVRLDTINPPGNEDQCARLLAELLEAAGYRCELIDFAPRRTSLVARIGQGGGKPIAFTGHIDVVPLGAATWQQAPFGGEIVDGRLYGRGSSDMKSGVAAFVVAAIAAAKAAAAGPGVSLVITAGEETGCEGAFHLARQAQSALGEAGALVVAEPTANIPLVGHKGAFWLRAHASGVTAHGSMPERGDNAFYKVARAALALEQFEFGVDAHALMGRPTLNVGTARAGLNINSVPDAAEMQVDIRTVAGQDHAALLGCLCRAVGPQIRIETLLDIESVYTDPDDPWMRRVFDVCERIDGRRAAPQTVSYFTDAAALRGAMGMPPTVILGPGEPQLAHQTDEYCEVAKVATAVQLFTALIEDWQRA